MNRYLVYLAVCLLVVGLLAGAIPVQAEPWPSYLAHTNEVDYVDVLLGQASGMWFYYVKVDAGAIDPARGTVTGVKGLAIYPAAGAPVPQIPNDWTGYETAFTRTGWDYDGGWVANEGAFGYITGSPSDYILADGQIALVGAAQFPVGYAPGSDQGFLLHVAFGTGNTEWLRPEDGGGPVPEPSGFLVLAGAAGTTLGALVRRRRNS